MQTSSVATFMAINGSGFFSVQKPGTFTDSAPVFDGIDRYTRRGDFQLDKNGYLVNGAGYYLEGIPDRSDDRQSFWQLAAGAEVSKRFSSSSSNNQN